MFFSYCSRGFKAMGVASTYISTPSPAPLALSGCKDIAEGAVFIIASGASAKDLAVSRSKCNSQLIF
ncbi:hypothetical protein [Pseudomonas helleri]|uniref:Uncharacterized protein n=1 Tax=Pseudomonas helleri TaxID=1608996 RepID=A0A7X1YDZ6_9PSED|nr:hypothetical protein [Pseudomonas helleri]MQT97780.1 hypothetical protein [Pseudomonas helleri]MQU35022.1 hypothetical protein [Pseudomonas helleri]